MDGNPRGTFLIAFALVWASSLAIYCVWQVRRRRKYLASSDWPGTPGKFRDGMIRRVPRFQRRTRYDVFGSFEYTVLGATYQGRFSEGEFYDQDEAENLFERIKAGKMFVRYNPGKPKDYFVDGARDVRA